MLGECTACKILDKDTSMKEVTECVKCKAYLCAPCAANVLRRAKAMAARAYRNLKS